MLDPEFWADLSMGFRGMYGTVHSRRQNLQGDREKERGEVRIRAGYGPLSCIVLFLAHLGMHV